MMVILTYSILWLIGECDWLGRGLGVLQQKQDQMKCNSYSVKQDDICCFRFVETMNEMNDKKETWIRLNGWAR